MTYQQTGDGFGARDWVTIIGPNVFIYLSDGGRLSLLADDKDAPSYWRIEHVDSNGQVDDTSISQHFPVRAGALEFSRKWMADHNVTSVPSDDQRAAPWYQERQKEKWEHGRKNIRQVEPDPDLTKALEMAAAIDMAVKIDAAMRAAPPAPISNQFPPIVVHDDWATLAAAIDAQMHPTYRCPRCKSTFGTSSCPECGGVAEKVN